MQEIKGQYANAKIYADVVEQAALDQIQTLCDQPFAEGSHIAVMPDVHAGVGCTIGTTMTIDPMNGKVCPNLVGVDIGCGMSVTELGNIDSDFSELDRVVHKMIPSGRNAHSDNVSVPYPVWENTLLENTRQTVMRYLTGLNTPININYELDRLGTLGSGNHYIEIDKDEEGNKYLVIHSGSRHLGVSVCSYFMDVANAERIGSKERHDKEKKELITRLKAEGRSQDIASALIAFDQGFVPSESSALAYVEKDNLLRYLNDMKIAQWFAQDNRNLMTNIICAAMNWTPVNHWETVHNYIDIDHGILRKGSISLRQGERALIPVSMKDGAFIVKGKGNPDYNYSGPHGAGRLLSRTEAKRSISLKDFEESMKGIYTTSVNEDTLDESAFAYKRLEDILPSLEPTAEIEKRLVPVYNFKAGE